MLHQQTRRKGANWYLVTVRNNALTAAGIAFFTLIVFSVRAPAADQSLSLWNDGPVKAAILDFVSRVTNPDSPQFVPVSERIAVFDHDGTLWCEQPMYVQLAFVIDRIKALEPLNPEWKTRMPFAALLRNDLNSAFAGGEMTLIEPVMASHAGMTSTEFEDIVRDWIKTARHPKFDRPYTECVYQPMLELLVYLRQAGFKNYIVSGGGIEFMRPWVEQVYGLPREQVIGSSLQTMLEYRDGKPVVVRLPRLDFINDKFGKPIAIQKVIGRRPLMAFGNSDGDLQMLDWTTAGDGLRFGMLVHHTDDEREYAYDRKSRFGQLDRALDLATEQGWMVMDMKHDWKRVFAFQGQPADPITP